MRPAVGDTIEVVPFGEGMVVGVDPGRRLRTTVVLDEDRESGRTIAAVRWRGTWVLE